MKAQGLYPVTGVRIKAIHLQNENNSIEMAKVKPTRKELAKSFGSYH